MASKMTFSAFLTCVITVMPICFLALGSLSLTNASSVTGTVILDRYTFDKVLSKFDAVLVKFDSAYPYGDKDEEFQKFAKASVGISNFIAAEIHIEDYGDRKNSDLADRFSVPSDDKDKFPFVKLFVKNKADEPIDFVDSNFNVESLKRFVKKNSDIYFGLDGCLEYYDQLSRNFVQSTGEEKSNILSEAKLKSEKLPGSNRSSASIYLKLMDRVTERGNGFINSEKTRIQNIRKGKITDEKRQELQIRLNILDSFTSGPDSKNEL